MASKDGLDINIKEVSDASVRIQRRRQLIKEQLELIKKEIDYVDSKWDSMAQGVVSLSLAKLPEKIEAFDKDLDTYAKSLKQVADEYGYVEMKIFSNAESFH